MDTVGYETLIKRNPSQAAAIARERHPAAVKMTLVFALVVFLDLSTDSSPSIGWMVLGAILLGGTLLLVTRMRAATVAGLLQGADTARVHYSVSDTNIAVQNGPLMFARDWDSITSTSIHRGYLNLVARGGAISIPLADAPDELLAAIDSQLRRREVPEPPPPPSFRRTYFALLAIVYVSALVQIMDKDPSPLERYCDKNPGAEYWDDDGPHTC